MTNKSGGQPADLTTILDTKSVFDETFECQYHDIEDMFGQTKGKFTVLSQNVRSLGGKFDSIKEYIGRQKETKITCIALQEIWSIGRNYDLPGYHPLEYNSRDKNKTLNSNCGGGVGLFISNSVDYEILEFKDGFVDGVYESIWVKLTIGNGRSKILGTIYRPNTARGDLNRAIAIHESILKAIKSDKKLSSSGLLIFSDFNADLLNYHNHIPTAKYVDLQLELGLLPLITIPTRKYHNSATLIDHIFASKPDHSIKVGVLEDSELSDHFGTAYLEDVDVSEKMSNPIPRRKITKEATKDFISLATSIDWDSFEKETDDQKYYTGILDKIENIVDEAFPIRVAVPKVSKITPPWFTKGLVESSKCKKKIVCKVQEKADTSK